jgi:heme exporter protein D
MHALEQLAEFLDMGNHGLYVWGIYGGHGVLMMAEPMLVLQGRKTPSPPLRGVRAPSKDAKASVTAKARCPPGVGNIETRHKRLMLIVGGLARFSARSPRWC